LPNIQEEENVKTHVSGTRKAVRKKARRQITIVCYCELITALQNSGVTSARRRATQRMSTQPDANSRPDIDTPSP